MQSSILDSHYLCYLFFRNSTVPNQPAGIFWAVVNRLLIILQTVVLFLSEVGWPYKFFDKFFPILGTHFGLGAPGLFQCFIGAAVLSHHVDDFALVAAFFLFSLGCVNILVGLIFREKGKEKRSLLSWRAEKKKGLLPFVKDAAVSQAPAPLRPFLTNLSSQPPSFISRLSHTDEKAAADEKHAYGPGEFGQGRGYGWGRAAEKFAAGKGLLISKPVEALPPYGPGARVPPSISRPTATVEDAPEDDENAQRRQGQPQFRSSNESL